MKHAFGDADATPLERSRLVRIVGQQADRPEAELADHFSRGKVDTLVRVKAQLLVGVKGVETGVLQMISPELVDEPYAASLLREVEKYPTPRARDRRDRSAQRVATVAAQAGEQIASKALLM